MSQTPEAAPAHVSVVNEFPEDLYDAMRNFVRSHPHWDQYRLMQVAVAGFLFQQGSRERAVARHYLDGLFDRAAAAQPAAAPAQLPSTARSDAATPVSPAGPAPASVAAAGLPPAAVTPLQQRSGAAPQSGAPLRPVTPPGHHSPASPFSRRAA